ncbi:MAG TPA: NUDIX domain-containing protein [Steroidobacteraceae bacterium]|nr:NUDIX domain-containing protein [Steroidobacteraceae bacterium]
MSGDRATRLSAGVVVVRRAPAAWLFLMLRAYRNWDFPKGMVEPGEEPLAAARREVAEETSIEQLEFTWGSAYQETARYAGNKIARYYIAQTDVEAVRLPINPELGRPEHDEWRWLTYDAALALASARLLPVVGWAARILGVHA